MVKGQFHALSLHHGVLATSTMDTGKVRALRNETAG
jgi:hypothetical protein